MIISSIERIAFNTCCGNFGINLIRGFGTKILATEQPKVLSSNKFLVFRILTYNSSSDASTKNVYTSSQLKSVRENFVASQLKKRPIRKKRLIPDDEEILQPGFWSVKALATAEEYNLEALMDGLITQDLYVPKKINTSDNYRNSSKMDDKRKLLPSCIKVPLDSDELEELIERAKDWALMHGMGVRPTSNLTKDIIQFAPFSLLPSVFPREEFINACEIQPILNTLMHRVAHDYKFLKETLKETIRVDEFTRRLFQIYETVHNEGFKQKISLGLLRSDLMLDSCCGNNSNDAKPFCCWKQVEINTIASGMAWLGPVTTKFHKFILTELGFKNMIKSLPDNNALQGICGGILEAWKLYNDPRAQILFVVEDFTFNICDQRLHEFEIKRQNPNVRVIRRTLTQLINQAKLGEKNELIVNDKVVSVVYFRCGYEPGQYHSEKEWDIRLLIERSLAIKSPSIQYHLAGTKKVQQALAKPGVVAQYLRNEKTVARVQEIFTGLYELGTENAILRMALSNPERFVLKPQREGGGNNIYGTDIPVFLESMKSPQERHAWILMDRIHPPPQLNYIIRPGSIDSYQLKQVISELGIFGVIIGDEKTIYSNKQVGHMFRTKLTTSNEGGLMSGTAVTDSPFLID